MPVNARDILVFCTEIMKELFPRFAGVLLDFVRRATAKVKKHRTYDDVGDLDER